MNETKAVETPWAFEIGQAVKLADGTTGDVTWRRENQAGQRDFLVNGNWYAQNDVASA